MRPKIAVTNYSKSGQVFPDRWFVKVGSNSRTFTEAEWVSGGVAWIQAQL